jgi:YesN/AraC family two-component response regulator
VLLTDVVMPGMSGAELAATFKAQHPNVKVIFMSGYTDDVLVRTGLSRAQITLLAKPFSLTDLVDKLRWVLTGGK